MAKLDELHNYAYPDNYLDELHIYDKKLGSNGIDEIHNYGNRGVTYGMDELHLYGSYQTEETSIDEVNKPDKKYEVIDIDEYFDEIEVLDEEQKEERKELANEFKDIMMLIFMLMLADLRVGNELNEGFYHSLAKSRLMDAVDRVMPSLTADIYVEIENYINQNLNYVIETTINNSDQPYMFSEARATSLAVDDSLASFNIEELNEAIKAGYKYKIWTSMRDRKVRHTHEVADGQKVEIEKPFKVGRCLMTAPMVFDEKSLFQDAKEVVNCRCQLIYSFSKDEKEPKKAEVKEEDKKNNQIGTSIQQIINNNKPLFEISIPQSSAPVKKQANKLTSTVKDNNVQSVNTTITITQPEIKEESKNTEEVENTEKKDIISNIKSDSTVLSQYTPATMKERLEEEGYEVIPLGRGSYKNIPFEEGGGYRIHFGGNGLFTYHPAHGHHGDEPYYKLSDGENGIRRYSLDGTEIKDEQ